MTTKLRRSKIQMKTRRMMAQISTRTIRSPLATTKKMRIMVRMVVRGMLAPPALVGRHRSLRAFPAKELRTKKKKEEEKEE